MQLTIHQATTSQSRAYDCDVLIVGLGPVGAALAALLGRRGISVRAVEAERTVYPLPRAAHIDHEIMRIFQAIGLVDVIRPHLREAPDYEFRTKQGETLIRVAREGVMGVSGWPVAFNIYQPGIETEIRALLTSLPSVATLFGARFAGIEENSADGVTALIDVDGTRTRCSARFLVGCDGARSAVRGACGIGLDDYDFDEPWLVIDARVRDENDFPRTNLQICDPARPTSFVHMGPGRLRWEFMLKPGENPETMKDDEALDGLLAPWRRRGAIEVERVAVYRFHGLVASRWRHESVFLVGDSAHQMPPFMGQGLCSGLRDAANLAWKLEAALDVHSGDRLLDSYEAERAPHVRFVVEKAIEMGRIVCALDQEAAAARDAKMVAAPRVGPPVALPALGRGCILPGSPGAGTLFPQAVDHAAGLYLDDILGRGAWLIHQAGKGPGAAAGPIRIVDASHLPRLLREVVSEWLVAAKAIAVLVRPDRYIFGTGSPDALIEAYSDWLAPRRGDAQQS